MSSHMRTSALDDYIGVESCFDFAPDAAGTPSRATAKIRPPRHTVEKKFPPPISRLPRVMKKYTTSDGRVLIMEEKAERQHCIRAHRADGRLVLALVEESSSDDGGDGGDPAVEGREERRYAYGVMGVNPCGGFGVQAAFGHPVLT